MASNITVDTLTKGATTLNTDELVDVNNTRVSKAWVNFNGTGTVAIRASFNVSGITDNGTGDYTVNFTTAMVDDDYAISLAEVGNTTVPSASTSTSSIDVQSYSSTALTIRTFNHLGSANDTFVEDIASVFVTVHGN